MASNRNFPKALIATGLAAALVGCGGGSSDDTAMDPEPTPLPLPGNLPSDFTPTPGTLHIPAGGSRTSGGVVFSCASGGESCTVTIGADGATTSAGGVVTSSLTLAAQAIVDQANLDAQKTAVISGINDAVSVSEYTIGLVTKTASPGAVASADGALQNLKKAIDDATVLSDAELAVFRQLYNAHATLLNQNKADRIAYMKAEEERKRRAAKKIRDDHAKLWIAAINAYDPGTTVNDFDSLDSYVSDLDIYGNTIKLDDENGDPIFPRNHMSPSRGWTAKSFTETTGESYGVVVSNSKPDRTVTTRFSWSEYFYESHPYVTTPKAIQPIPGITPQANTGVLDIDNGAVFNSSHFGGLTGQSLSFDENSHGTKNVTYNGVRGELECSDLPCLVTVMNNGDFSFNKTVTFTPTVSGNDPKRFDDVILSITETVRDTDYLAFGYWITKTDSDTKPKYNIHTFAEDYNNGYGDPTGTPDLLTGSASYSGAAAGVYVLKENITDDNPDLYNGEFVAGVDLKAQFGDTGSINVPEKDKWKITGTIDGFRSVTDTSHNLSRWELMLEADLGERLRGRVEPPAALSLHNPVTMGGGAAGTWNASFFGDSDDGNGDPADDHPEAIAGEFVGHFVDGHVAGAFGAEKD